MPGFAVFVLCQKKCELDIENKGFAKIDIENKELVLTDIEIKGLRSISGVPLTLLLSCKIATSIVELVAAESTFSYVQK